MENAKYRILLVEDDELDQIAFKRLLETEKLPYECTVARSAAQAREILNAQRFDIVISDYMLGDGTALDILESAKNTPFVFVTGVGDEELAVKVMKAGACDYLVKDLEGNYLKTVPITVENAVNNKKMQEKLKLLSHAIMSTEDSIYITDMEHKIIFVNSAFCETYGYKEAEIVGKDDSILWEKNDARAGNKKSYQVVGGWEVGFYHKRKDGGEFPVSLTSSVVKDDAGSEVAIVSVARDISERITFEESLRAENLKLKNLLSAKEKTSGASLR